MTYKYTAGTDFVLLRGGAEISLPMAASLNGKEYPLSLSSEGDNFAVYSGEGCEARVDFARDSVKIALKYEFEKTTPIYESVVFFGGVKVKGFDRALNVQPRNNGGKNMDFFFHLPDISSNGYFSPPELNMILGSPEGTVAIGLLDIPDSKLCRLQPDMSFLVESCGGNKKVKTYCVPEILVTFPEDEWQGVSLFREKLIEYGRYTPEKPKFSEVPSWWKNPLICTYGDQLIQDRVGQRIDEEWVMDFVRTAEEKWGHKNINLIIDDSWQHCQSFQPKSDTARFPDMRALSDKLHERGHKVILWTRPLFDNVLNGFETLSQQYNILTSYSPASAMPDHYKGSYMIDYTADTARDFLHEICLGLFGSGEGQFDADGVKLDFIGTIRDPSLTDSYSHPEKGIGMRELYLFYKMFSEEARKIKSDVLIDCTVGDPRFEGFITHNRLHDTHAGVEEKELRAKLSTLACPGLIVDCDGALMYSHWLRNHYISAAVYSVPSNYYLNGFQDYRNWNGLPEKDEEWAKHHDLDDREKLDFGALLDMTAYRPDGNPVMDDFGQWRLVTEDGQTNAYSKRGDTVIYYPEREGETGYIFTFRSEAQILPLFGRKISDLTPAPWRDTLQLDYARDRFITHLIPGVVYTFRWEDSGDSIDRAFREADTGTVEGEVDYVN